MRYFFVYTSALFDFLGINALLNFFLFITTALIWGSTWLAIQFQLGVVSPVWSVAYRFGFTAILLFIFCLITRRNLRFTAAQHRTMMLQGALLFSLNYILYYVGSQYFISGLVAVIFATIIVMNIMNSRIFFKTQLVARVILGAILGLIGLVVVFSSQFAQLDLQANLAHTLLGVGICVFATFVASLGNIASIKAQRMQLPILQSTTFGLIYGTLIVMLVALIFGIKPSFDISQKYVMSLLYLSIVGTIGGFTVYLHLLGRIGAERAAYAFVVLPLVSLALSTEFEGFRWTLITFAGIALVVIGNVLVLKNKMQKKEIN